jgi:DNA-binding NarL/FixJ family response regulator
VKIQSALLLEDDAAVREWLTSLVLQAFPDVQIAQAWEPAQANQIFSHRPVDLAIIDLQLGAASGLDTIAFIKARRPTTVCVIATTFKDDQHIFQGVQAGADGYLLKSEPPARLVQRLIGITRGDPPLSPDIARRILGHFSTVLPEHHDDLTDREREVLTFIGKGLSQPEVAKLLKISINTVKDHTKNVYRKLNVSSRAEAAVAASRLGLL